MSRSVGLTLMALAWVAVVWGWIDESVGFEWFGEWRSVAYLAAPLIVASIWLLLRSQNEPEEPGDELE